MKKDNTVKLSVGIGLVATIICAITALYSYHAYDSLQQINGVRRQSLDELHQEVARLEAKVSKLGNELAAVQEQAQAATGNLNVKKSGIRASQSSVAQRQSLAQMEQILDSTGLALLAENENVDPNILQQMYDEYAQRNQVAAYRQALLQKDRERLDSDRKNYEEELMSLYELARMRRGSDTDRATREKAFGEMLAKYPDAYATAKVVGERALWSALRRNTTEVEEYYNLLRQNDKFSTVATDRGTEVLPNVEHYLIQQYLRQGRIEDARVLRDSLELNFPDSYIVRIRGPLAALGPRPPL